MMVYRAAAPLLVVACALAASAKEWPFTVNVRGEVVAELDMRSPGSDWAKPGREAAVATASVDGSVPQHVILYGGPAVNTYRIFLGELSAGDHKLSVARDGRFSAGGADVGDDAVRFKVYDSSSPAGQAIASAPVLYIRPNTVRQFSDVPMIVYSERLVQEGKPYLQYTAIFSNEDGGTSTRALMARWGRSTDIEYMYRVALGADGRPGRAIIQGPNHVEQEWSGPMEGLHPLLMPVTNNNTFGAARQDLSPMRFQIAPIAADLRRASRESVMDQYPVTYDVMGKELLREGKLRAFGVVDGEKVSDPRNYLFVDYGATHVQSAFTAVAVLKDGREFVSDLGRLDYAISRDGWVRTTIELPPGTAASDVSGLSFVCKALKPETKGSCTLVGVPRVFLLGNDGRPGPALAFSSGEKTVPAGGLVKLTRQ